MSINYGLLGGQLDDRPRAGYPWQSQRASENVERALVRAVTTGVDATDGDGLSISVDELLDRRQALRDNLIVPAR